MAPGRQEREAHGPADHQGVHHLQQRVDHGELVRHLGPAQHGHKWPPGRLPQTAQHCHLPGQQPARGRRQPLGRADNRGVGPVRRPESVVHVGVVALDEAVDEGRIAGGLACLEPQVLQQVHPRRQRRQPAAHRLDGVAGVGAALGASEVGAGRDRGPLLLQPAQRRQGGPDAQVVGYLRDGGPTAAGERHIEVDPHQHGAALQRTEILQARQFQHRRTRRQLALSGWRRRR